MNHENREIVGGDPHDLQMREPFAKLFTSRKETESAIIESMRLNGYYPSQPIVVWREQNVVVDGNTRVRAAIKAGIKDVCVCFMDFASEIEALEYAIKSQVDRRNLTRKELIKAVALLDERRQRGGDHTSEAAKAKCADEHIARKRSHETTAEVVGTSPATVRKLRAIQDYAKATGDRSDLEAYEAGKVSLNAAHKSVQAKKKAGNPPKTRKSKKPKAENNGPLEPAVNQNVYTQKPFHSTHAWEIVEKELDALLTLWPANYHAELFHHIRRWADETAKRLGYRPRKEPIPHASIVSDDPDS